MVMSLFQKVAKRGSNLSGHNSRDRNECVNVIPTKKAFWDVILSASKAHPPQKCKFYFYCRLAVSDQKIASDCGCNAVVHLGLHKSQMCLNKAHVNDSAVYGLGGVWDD